MSNTIPAKKPSEFACHAAQEIVWNMQALGVMDELNDCEQQAIEGEIQEAIDKSIATKPTPVDHAAALAEALEGILIEAGWGQTSEAFAIAHKVLSAYEADRDGQWPDLDIQHEQFDVARDALSTQEVRP